MKWVGTTESKRNWENEYRQEQKRHQETIRLKNHLLHELAIRSNELHKLNEVIIKRNARIARLKGFLKERNNG